MHTRRHAHTRTHTYGKFRAPSSPHMNVFGLLEEPGKSMHTQEEHANSKMGGHWPRIVPTTFFQWGGRTELEENQTCSQSIFVAAQTRATHHIARLQQHLVRQLFQLACQHGQPYQKVVFIVELNQEIWGRGHLRTFSLLCANIPLVAFPVLICCFVSLKVLASLRTVRNNFTTLTNVQCPSQK